MMAFNKYITRASDLVTSPEQTKAGFLSIALEKNRLGDPYVQSALAFKAMLKGAAKPEDFLADSRIRPFLLTASGLSDKSMNYLDEADRTKAIEELIENFLKPAGADYADEAIYRYLLIKGDAVGGSMRNRIGALGEEKLIRCILSCLSAQGIRYKWAENVKNKKYQWFDQPEGDAGIEKRTKALCWKNRKGQNRLLVFDMTLSAVKKNVDICLFDSDFSGLEKGAVASMPSKAIMLGELKGGIDPAGADEHWKTASTALERIRTKFQEAGYEVQTSFVGAAIEAAMAQEIFSQLESGTLANAANLTDENQLVEYCNWLISL